MNSGINMILGALGAAVWIVTNWRLALSGIPLGMWSLLSLAVAYALLAWIWDQAQVLYRKCKLHRKASSAMRNSEQM